MNKVEEKLVEGLEEEEVEDELGKKENVRVGNSGSVGRGGLIIGLIMIIISTMTRLLPDVHVCLKGQPVAKQCIHNYLE